MAKGASGSAALGPTGLDPPGSHLENGHAFGQAAVGSVACCSIGPRLDRFVEQASGRDGEICDRAATLACTDLGG